MSLIPYLRDAKGELRHINWPTQKQIIFYTIIVVAISLAVAFLLGLFDFGLTKLLNIFII